MTREEAVNELNDRIKSAEYVDSDYIDCVSVDAVKMAISALSVPETNVGDTISRQAAIDAINQYYKDKKYITRSRTILSAFCQDMKNIMSSLSPAQQDEYIMECRYCNNNPGRKPRGCPMAGNPDRKEDDYCSYWERRTYATD